MTEELEPGANVTSSVRLVRPLAEGGMGKVWIAEHLVLDTRVVVKLMSKDLDGLAGAAARFAREAAVAAAVKSPHVVQVFDSGVTETGVAYIVMELLEGHDLGAHLASRGRLAPAEAVTVIAQLCKALAKAHRVGVVHRDIKPDNVFLCDVEGGEPFVKLLDFGTAKDEARAPFATTAGQLLGTPYYMSPEQILGEDVGYRTDIWSVGVLAFEALTGRRPFEGVTVGAITLAIHTTTPRMTDVVPDLPPALDEWFERACARSPDERFPTAKAAGEAFARAISGEAAPERSGPDSDPAFALTPSVPPPFAADGASPRPGLAQTKGERVATSLSSTLSSPRAERRVMTWIAGGVGAVTLALMVALLTHDEPSAPPAAASSSVQTSSSPVPAASSVAAAPPVLGPVAAATPSATTPSSVAAAPTFAPSVVTPAATPAPAPAPSSTVARLPSPPPSVSARPSSDAVPPLPTFTPRPQVPRAQPSSTFPFGSASASASAPTPRPSAAPTARPTAEEPPAPAPPPAEPLPAAPIDLHDLLPPEAPSQ